MKNTRADGGESGYEGQMPEGCIQRQAVRDCPSLEGKLVKMQRIG